MRSAGFGWRCRREACIASHEFLIGFLFERAPFHFYQCLSIIIMQLSVSRLAEEQGWQEEERVYAEQQLRKIYSQQLARLMREKKFYLITHANRQQLDCRIERFQEEKVDRLARMMEKSHQRKEKLIRDRVKACEMSDKRWFEKKEQIRSRVKQQEQSMVEVAKGYRLKSETFWKERQASQRQQLREFSAKYHRLYNSKAPTTPSPSHSHLSFDQNRLASLLQKRTTRLTTHPSPTSPSHDAPLQRQRSQRVMQQEQKIQRLMLKLSRVQQLSAKREQMRKKESLQRARFKLNQKVYRSKRPQIGQNCSKHSRHEDHFNSKTRQQQTPSPHRTTLSRTSSLALQQQRDKREESLLKYYQKTRRLKLTKQLKLNVRTALNNKLRQDLKKQQ